MNAYVMTCRSHRISIHVFHCIALLHCVTACNQPVQTSSNTGTDHSPTSQRPQPIASMQPNSPEPTASDVEPTFVGNITPIKRDTMSGVVGLLSDVRFGDHSSYDRMVFEFTTEHVPGYSVAYVTGNIASCGSGEAFVPNGKAVLLINISPASAHTVAGVSLLKSRNQSPGLSMVKNAAQLCDHEGQVSWAIGLRNQSPFRVETLSSPSRLVIDIGH